MYHEKWQKSTSPTHPPPKKILYIDNDLKHSPHFTSCCVMCDISLKLNENLSICFSVRLLMFPSQRTATMLWPWRPRKSTNLLCGRRITVKHPSVSLQWGPCCARTALWDGACCQMTTTLQHPGHALSATNGDHRRSECYLTRMLIQLRRLHYIASAPVIRITSLNWVRVTDTQLDLICSKLILCGAFKFDGMHH